MAEQNVTAAQNSLIHFAKLLKEFATKIDLHEDRTSYWQAIFSQSKANGSVYRGEDLPHVKWQWPKDTWFQEQVRCCRQAGKFAGHQVSN